MIPTDQQSFQDALLSTAADYFRTTEAGQKFEAEYIKQAVGEQTSNPLLWIGVGLLIMFLVYPWLHFKR